MGLPLYRAETVWRRNDPRAGQSISLGGARDLTEEIIHNPIHDEVPHIEDVRSSFKRSQVQGTNILPAYSISPERSAAITQEGRMLVRRNKLNVGTVTHEASHLVERLGRQFQAHTPDLTPEEGHDAEFARQHLRTIHAAVNPQSALNLREMYRHFNVDVRGPRK